MIKLFDAWQEYGLRLECFQEFRAHFRQAQSSPLATLLPKATDDRLLYKPGAGTPPKPAL